MTNPLVSIILPTHSRCEGGYLERTIQSVLSQRYNHWELLIVDDGSVDGSMQLIERYCRLDTRIKHIRLAVNVGFPAYTTALGYLESKGDYIAFAFDDSVLLPNHLLLLIDAMLRNPNAGFVYGQCRMISSNQKHALLGSEFDMAQMVAGNNHVPNAAVMIRRNAIEQVGWYDPHVILKRICDWDLWIRIARKYPVKFFPQIIVEEYGIGLHGSLGNSVSLFYPLVKKYMQQYRDSLLKPNQLHNYDSFRVDFSNALSSEDIQNVSYLQLEHYIKTVDIEKLVQFAANSIKGAAKEENRMKKINLQNQAIKDLKQKYLIQACHRYIEQKNEISFQELLKIRELISDKDEYINKKQAYVEEQWSLMHQKDAYIQHQSAMIQQKDEYIAEQHRLIHHLQSLLQ